MATTDVRDQIYNMAPVQHKYKQTGSEDTLVTDRPLGKSDKIVADKNGKLQVLCLISVQSIQVEENQLNTEKTSPG